MVIYLALVAIILVAGCTILKKAGCGKRPPRPPRIVTVGPFEVIRAETGSTLVVKSGRRRSPERIIQLQGVAAPMTGKWVGISRDHLKEMAGSKVTVQYEKHGIFRGEAGFPECDGVGVIPGVPDPVSDAKDCPTCLEAESRGPLRGIVLGESGIDLNMGQISGGYAEVSADCTVEMEKAAAAALAAKRGIWSE